MRPLAIAALCCGLLAGCSHAEEKKVDRSCRVDADCAVKNVGNCCGYYPACVNQASPTFPEQVKKQCEAEGRMAVCGFQDVNACRCVQGQCAAVHADSAEPRAQ